MSYLFESPRLGFRRWKESDTEPFIGMCGDPVVMEFFPSPLSREEGLAFRHKIDEHLDNRGFGFWAIEEKKSGQFVGFIGFAEVTFESFFSPCIEIGWRLDKPYWGQGYATEGAKACCQYGFTQLGFEQIYAFTAVVNKRSERVMQKAGMEYAGAFEHPRVEEGHLLRPHVLYKITKAQADRSRGQDG